MRDVEVRADAAAADAEWVAGGLGRVDAAEEQPVVPDVANRVDARRAVLAAPAHHLAGERELAAVAEGAARARVIGRLVQRILRRVVGRRKARVDAGDRRVLVPELRKVEEPRLLHRADELLD